MGIERAQGATLNYFGRIGDSCIDPRIEESGIVSIDDVKALAGVTNPDAIRQLPVLQSLLHSFGIDFHEPIIA